MIHVELLDANNSVELLAAIDRSRTLHEPWVFLPTSVTVDDTNRSSDGSQKKTVRFVRENSGLIVTFGISNIVKAIRKNPVGIPAKGR